MAEHPADQRCSNCTAWRPDNGGESGFCQAHPPLPMFGAHAKQPGSGVPQLEFFFPITDAGDWCREFQMAGAAP